MARDAIIDRYRTRRRHESIEEGAAQGVPASELPAGDPDGAVAARELARCLRPLVERLPPMQREALIPSIGEVGNRL